MTLQVGGPLGLFGITDAQGVGSPSLAIPAIPALVGLAIEVAGFTIDPSQPFSIGNISNNHRFVIEP